MQNYIKGTGLRISYMPINNFKSKWANLKSLLKQKASLESSVKLLKRQTLNQFSSNCRDIYKYKIEINLLNLRNKNIFSSLKNKKQFEYPKIVIDGNVEEICYDTSLLKKFIFYFRENNEEMLKLIKVLNIEQRKIFVPFLCHFFYENFFMESTEQEEIFYILYLLLEKEIDNLCAPLADSFLNGSFLGDFFIEMGNKIEIKNYLDIVLNSLIRDLEESYSEYYSLDIIKNSKLHYNNFIKNTQPFTFFNMNRQNFYENELFFSQSKENFTIIEKKSKTFLSLDNKYSNTFTRKSMQMNQDYKYNDIIVEIKYEKSPINMILNKKFFNTLTENQLKELFSNEKDEFMKSFYLKQLKKIKSLSKPNLFNFKDYYYIKMVNCMNISKESIEHFNEGYTIIYEFIDKLLVNLENKVRIPYIIKVICKMIYLLIKKRFKNISEFHINILICCFIFDKLIIPILENPDKSNIAKTMMISISTRKSLLNISTVLKKFIRGELFFEEKYEYYIIFNQFILENYKRLKIIVNNFIDVNLPEKISLLISNFYKNQDFSLENLKRKSTEINYEYFKENPSEFMQHDSICFNIEQFLLIYDIVNNNQDLFIQSGSIFEKIFNEISKYIPQINKSNPTYYVIIKENYIPEEKELLYHKEKNLGLSRPKKPEDLLYKIKFAITFLLSNIEISNQWEWVNGNYDTKETFNFINRYLSTFEKKEILKRVPLNWYSKYILNNLEKINSKYIENDYILLFEEIEKDTNNLIDKLIELNDFLTVNIRTKFALIENRKKSFKQELKEMENTELYIKTLLFIESAEIGICFLTGNDYNEIQTKMVDPKPKVDKKDFVISNRRYCPHKKYEIERKKTLENVNLSKFHCNKIKDFIVKFNGFHKMISDEINNSCIESSFIQKTSIENQKIENLKQDKLAIKRDPKDILDVYMNYVAQIIQDHPLFNFNKDKKNNEKVSKIIWNYILQSLCIKICNTKIFYMDEAFSLRCKSLNSFIKPKNLDLPEELCDENILKEVRYHLEKMDNKRTPDGVNQEFGIAVQLISSLYKFYLNETQIEAGDLLSFIIYCLVSIKTKRIIFNINFSKYFLSSSELAGNYGYNLIQAESAINYINKLDARKLGISEKEFNDYLSKIKF